MLTAFFSLGPVFSSLFFLTQFSVLCQKQSSSAISHSKMYSILLKGLKQQFPKMADDGNIEVAESSFSTAITARKFLKILAEVIQTR